MTARDILQLDDAEFGAAIESVKRRMPQPPGQRLQGYTREWHDTVPTSPAPLDYLPGWYLERRAKLTAELHAEDKWKPGEGSGPFLWPLVVVIVVALASFVAWVTK